MDPALRRLRVAVLAAVCVPAAASTSWAAPPDLDARGGAALRAWGFTGRVQSTLQQRLGRPLDPRLANLGRLLWFDVLGGLHRDNTCGGCHSPANRLGDRQSHGLGA